MRLTHLIHLALALVVTVSLQGNLYIQTSTTVADHAVHAGASDGWTGDVGPSPQPIPATQAEAAMLDGLVDRMTQRWATLDATCDPAAVFALAYLITTTGVVAHVKDAYFDDNGFVARWTVAFAERYEHAIDAWMAGDTEAITGPWLDVFERAQAGETTVEEDAVMGMNVHIRYDLARVTEAMDIVEEHRKQDFDRINDALASIREPSQQALAEQYDPAMGDPGPDEGASTMQMIYAWREEAWTDAEALTDLPTSAQPVHLVGMERRTLAYNEALTSPRTDAENQAAQDQRLAYCQQQNQAA